MQTALIVIDFQNAVFIAPAAHQAQQVLARIAALIAAARAAGTPVIYVQHEEAGCEWERGTDSWQFPAAIAPQPGDFISTKSQCDAFFGTGLQAHLQQQGIQRVVICGYATEFCIDTNVRHAASSGLAVTVAADAHTTRDRAHLDAARIIEHHAATWRGFGGIQLIDSAAIHFGAE
ncbi:Nicotinamidase-related amidase [Duganella sp. CF402]|uniref:isochorismatase family protein n=1 Tax=unclassified Duganella TaxID=2636909 RepID=UPI0008ABFA78|nr:MULTISPECIES: isochorismatase family protein [unclassified Duganella]RZT06247.1 nicotinamidase-related amidase [Duganella sp. BK701]SEM70672.1 Nicotinamidase-related amidase [Duganella sp. CF402]